MNTPRPAGKSPRLPYPVARSSGGRSPALLLALITALLLLLPALAAQADEITDQDGTKVTFERPFSRIISLYPAHTENLVELGLAAEIIGVSKGDNPPSVADRPRFSDTDNAEKFIAAAPDLLLVRPMISRAHPQLLARLRQSGITVVSLQPTGIEEMFAYWQTLGRLTGRSEAAEDMRKRFLAGVADIQKGIPDIAEADRPGVYVESIHSKMKTFSPASMTIYAVEAAGGRNIAADARPRNNSNIAEYGKEQIIAKAGEIDIFLSQTGRMNPVDSETLKNETGFQLIKAFRENRVHLIAEELVSRPTLRLLTGIEQLHRLFYPQQGADNR